MVAGYRVTGADMGLSLPLVEADVLKVPDHAYRALKLNLRNELHEFYSVPLSQVDLMDARNWMVSRPGCLRLSAKSREVALIRPSRSTTGAG